MKLNKNVKYLLSLLLVLSLSSVVYAKENSSVESSNDMIMVNLNTASVGELTKLRGVGESYANRIVEYRQEFGPFKSIDEVQNVKGIGPATFEKIKEKVSIE